MRGDFCYTSKYEIHKQNASDSLVSFGPGCRVYALGGGAFCAISLYLTIISAGCIVLVSKPEKGF